MDPEDIGQLIREARKIAGMTLENLAEEVGLTAGALSHIEGGRRLPSPQSALLIAQALGIDEDSALLALDDAHRQRRYDSLSNPRNPRDRSRMDWSASPAAWRSRAYEQRPIEELLGLTGLDSPRVMASRRGTASPRGTARWSEDTLARVDALSELADSAADAIRTLRGLVDDDDPLIRREARRLLRELDVRMPEE